MCRSAGPKWPLQSSDRVPYGGLMKVFGNTQIFGIMGHPVEHSLSPVMHNAAFEALGIHAVYVPFMVKPEDLGKATMALRALNVGGVNITVPHKGGVIEFLDELDSS